MEVNLPYDEEFVARDDRNRELELLEKDEYGWSVVLKDGIFYYKNTFVYDHSTVNFYAPVFKNNSKKPKS